MSATDFAVVQQLNPVGYHREFIKNGVRVDGRGFTDLRRITVGAGEFSSSTYGSSLVHIGETKIACSVSVLIGTPSQQCPGSGDVGKLLFHQPDALFEIQIVSFLWRSHIFRNLQEKFTA
jgi:hypothetical protein